ncbi:MAG: Bacterial TniB protein [Verrucomicrobiota bacterium]|jgi:ribosomal protein S17E
MSTRRVTAGTRRTQHGWASAPEFDELRGLNGNAVAFKAALISDTRARELLFFLQAQSLREGGIKRIANELMETFPERLASPTMFKIGCKPGRRLSQKERDAIDRELHGGQDTTWDLLHSEEDRDREHCQSTAGDFLRECRDIAEDDLEQFIERLCCDPKLFVTNEDAEARHYRKLAEKALEESGHENPTSYFTEAQLCYFHDVLGSLFEYQQRHEDQVRSDFVETSIGSVAFEALDYALATGRSALIEGNAGIGKSTSLKAWTQLHLGRARFIQLRGITHRTGFFQELAKVFGIARGSGLSASKIQIRVENFLQRTKLMLVIDEAQYIFEAGNRVTRPPELVNWLMTACYNEGIPFVLSATSEFRERRAIVEKNTTWQSEQLRRRIRRFFALPNVPTKDDLTRVAQKLIPDLGRDAVNYVVGYSLVSKQFFQGITDAIEDARLIATRAGRTEIRFVDLKAAIQDWRSPSDAALQRVFAPAPADKRQRGSRSVPPLIVEEDSSDVQDSCNRLSGPLNASAGREILLTPA